MPIDPFQAAAAAGSVFDLFGGGNAGQDWLKDIIRFLMNSARSARQQGKEPPMSTEAERAALQQGNAEMGEQYANAYQQLLSSMGTSGPNASNAADALASFKSSQLGAQGQNFTQMLLQSIQNRQNMRFGVAPQIAASAMGGASNLAGMLGQQGGGLGQSLGMLAQLHAYQQAMNRAQPRTTAAPTEGIQQRSPMAPPPGPFDYMRRPEIALRDLLGYQPRF